MQNGLDLFEDILQTAPSFIGWTKMIETPLTNQEALSNRVTKGSLSRFLGFLRHLLKAAQTKLHARASRFRSLTHLQELVPEPDHDLILSRQTPGHVQVLVEVLEELSGRAAGRRAESENFQTNRKHLRRT